MSHPSWVRGLKSEEDFKRIEKFFVAPLVGAWIEMNLINKNKLQIKVAPLVGAWIEIVYKANFNTDILGRTPRGCVD